MEHYFLNPIYLFLMNKWVNSKNLTHFNSRNCCDKNCEDKILIVYYFSYMRVYYCNIQVAGFSTEVRRAVWKGNKQNRLRVGKMPVHPMHSYTSLSPAMLRAPQFLP